jgi:hypothetical protein
VIREEENFRKKKLKEIYEFWRVGVDGKTTLK